MGFEVLAYPFLFVAIFLEAFLLVTFLSAPARASRARTAIVGDGPELPSVAIIVPCWNEGETLAATTDSLLALDYPKDRLEVILVNNNSTDNTPEVMERYRANPQVRVLHEAQAGKHYAVNAGIAATQAEIIGCLDADSFVEPGALREMIPQFHTPTIAAVTAGMSIHQPSNLLQHMQNAEYIFGIMRQNALSVVHGIHVTPGPFSLYRRGVVLELGGFKHAYQTEDLEMALRLQRHHYHIANAPRARVYTKAPRTLTTLLRQRTRWTSGFLRNISNEYRDMIGSTQYGALGSITLPLGVLAIGGGILMFVAVLFQAVVRIVNIIEVRAGIPLSYSLLAHPQLDWFYLPASIYIVLSLLTITVALIMIGISKKVSGIPGSLATGIFAYLILYGLIAPLWLIRASTDVALGRKRGWR